MLSAAVIVILFFFRIPSEIAILVQCVKLLKAAGHLQLLRFKSIFIYKCLLKE